MGCKQMTGNSASLAIVSYIYIKQKTVCCRPEELTDMLCVYFKVIDNARTQAHSQLHKL